MKICKQEGDHHVIAVMRRQGKKLREIADLFGVTRERIRQITESLGVPKYPTLPMNGFAVAMKRALWIEGYGRCATCKEWSREVTSTQNRCRSCNRTYQRAYQAQRRMARI